MKKTARPILFTIILASLFLSALASAQEPSSSRVMVHAGKLLDVRSGKTLTDQAIVIEARQDRQRRSIFTGQARFRRSPDRSFHRHRSAGPD